MTHTLSALCAVLLGGPPVEPSDAELEARYQDAVIALQENHPEVAFGLFEWVLATVPTDHVLWPLATYGTARAAAVALAPGHACTGERRTRAYLALPGADPAKRERLARALPELEARCRAEAPAPVAPQPAPAQVGQVGQDLRATAPPVEPPPSGGLRTAGWVALAAGVALTAAGGYFWYSALQAQDAAAASTTIRGHRERVDAMESAEGWGLGLTLSGGLSLLGGGGLLVFGGGE